MRQIFDPETLERWRGLGPRETYEQAREALYRMGASSSEDFRDAFDELVEMGLLSWETIENFEHE